MADASSVLAIIRASYPTLRSSHERIAFAIHATMLASGFRLSAVGESVESESQGALLFLNSGKSNADDGQDVNPTGWNARSDSFSFRYVKDETNTKVVIKCIVLGNTLLVDAALVNTESIFNLELNVNEFVQENLPNAPYARQYKNLEKLVNLVKSKIIKNLDSISPAAPSGIASPGRAITEETFPPRGLQTEPGLSTRPRIVDVGRDDLMPGGGIPGFDHGRGVSPGGGMLLGPDDPRWGIGRPELDIPQGLPPGARFDPFGPPNLPGFNPDTFIRGRPNHQYPPTHPDLEDFRFD